MKNGFVLINKEKGISSSKVDYYLKKQYSLDKCGHLGTLDPLAVGLLVVGINRATKLFKYFDNLDKTYILSIRLGATTESLDYERKIVDKVDTNLEGKEDLIDEILLSFKKKYKQKPPIYSAIKKDGKKLYEYALKNSNIEIKERDIEIFDIERTTKIKYIDGSSYFDILMHVSKGFYVRSFCVELASKLNTIGMAHLINRIKVGNFDINSSISKEDFNEDNIIDPFSYINFKEIEIDDVLYKKIINGVRVNFNLEDEYIILKYKYERIAIYKKENSFYQMDELLK